MKPWHIINSKTISHNSKFWFRSWLDVWKTIFSHTLFSIFFLHYSFTFIQSSNFQLLPHQTVSLTVLSSSLIPIIIFFIFFYLLFIFFTSFVLERYRDSSWKKKEKKKNCWGMRVQPCRMPHATSPRVRHRGNDPAATPVLPRPSLQSDSSHSHAKEWPLFYTQSMKIKNRMHNLKLGILLTFKFICLYTIF